MDFLDQLMRKPLMKMNYFISESYHRTKRMGGWDGGWSKSGSITSSHFGDKRARAG